MQTQFTKQIAGLTVADAIWLNQLTKEMEES